MPIVAEPIDSHKHPSGAAREHVPQAPTPGAAKRLDVRQFGNPHEPRKSTNSSPEQDSNRWILRLLLQRAGQRCTEATRHVVAMMNPERTTSSSGRRLEVLSRRPTHWEAAVQLWHLHWMAADPAAHARHWLTPHPLAMAGRPAQGQRRNGRS